MTRYRDAYDRPETEVTARMALNARKCRFEAPLEQFEDDLEEYVYRRTGGETDKAVQPLAGGIPGFDYVVRKRLYVRHGGPGIDGHAQAYLGTHPEVRPGRLDADSDIRLSGIITLKEMGFDRRVLASIRKQMDSVLHVKEDIGGGRYLAKKRSAPPKLKSKKRKRKRSLKRK